MLKKHQIYLPDMCPQNTESIELTLYIDDDVNDVQQQ